MTVPTEREEQVAGVNLLRRVGFKVAVTSDRRRTNATGLPDVIAVGHRMVLQWETKAQGGKLSEAQMEWGARCRENGVPWVHGPMQALVAYLNQLGVLA